MALKEIKYNDTTIYIDDEIRDDEKGYALNIKDNLENTQKITIINESDLLEETQEFNFDSLKELNGEMLLRVWYLYFV